MLSSKALGNEPTELRSTVIFVFMACTGLLAEEVVSLSCDLVDKLGTVTRDVDSDNNPSIPSNLNNSVLEIANALARW